MDAVEFIKEYRRMCKKYVLMDTCGEDCSNECPLYGGYCDVSYENLEADYIVSKVEQWSQAHPQKTMMQDFFEKFPNAPKNPNGTPQFCPRYAGYSQQKDCTGCVNKYFECWSRPLEE